MTVRDLVRTLSPEDLFKELTAEGMEVEVMINKDTVDLKLVSHCKDGVCNID